VPILHPTVCISTQRIAEGCTVSYCTYLLAYLIDPSGRQSRLLGFPIIAIDSAACRSTVQYMLAGRREERAWRLNRGLKWREESEQGTRHVRTFFLPFVFTHEKDDSVGAQAGRTLGGCDQIEPDSNVGRCSGAETRGKNESLSTAERNLPRLSSSTRLCR
jgi:hypothetical protein